MVEMQGKFVCSPHVRSGDLMPERSYYHDLNSQIHFNNLIGQR